MLSAKTVLDRAIITINNYVVLLSKGASLIDIREKCLQHCLESFNETFMFNSVGVSCNKLKWKREKVIVTLTGRDKEESIGWERERQCELRRKKSEKDVSEIFF